MSSFFASRGRRGASGRRSSGTLGGRGSGIGNGFRLFRTRAVHRDHRRVLAASETDDLHAFRHGDVRQELGLVQVHLRQVELEVLRQVLRESQHFDVRQTMRHDAALSLHARGDSLALEVNRQTDADLLVRDDAQQVHVHHQVLGRVHLDVLHDRFLSLLAHLDLHDGRVEALVVDHGQQVLLIQHQRARLFLAAVENGRDLALVTQAAARTLALRITQIRADDE